MAQTFVSKLLDAATYRDHAVELHAAHGPKPIAIVEKLFATHYVPLLTAVGGGLGHGVIREVVEEWRTSFAHSYLDAFAVLRATGKRPPMVLDAPEIAARIGRLNGARKHSLVLVDGMRFDLGELVKNKLQALTAGLALCVEEKLLWAALPTTTSIQTALLARGPEGLRELSSAPEPELRVERGRAVSTLRRERIGSREILKLDLVEARLREPGPSQEERLDGIADEVAGVLARHLESLPPRTLLFVFGDHGFQLPVRDGGRSTGPATQGGASPEEVLVPGYAWLVDGVH